MRSGGAPAVVGNVLVVLLLLSGRVTEITMGTEGLFGGTTRFLSRASNSEWTSFLLPRVRGW